MNETSEHTNPLRGSDNVVFFLFVCALSFLLFAPLLIVLTSWGTASGYWLAAGTACIWLAVSVIVTWPGTPRRPCGTPRGRSAKRAAATRVG